MIQRRSARYVTNTDTTIHHQLNIYTAKIKMTNTREKKKEHKINPLIQNLQWGSKRLMLATNWYHLSIVQAYWRSLFPNIPSCKTSIKKESFYPRTIRDWNTLPNSVTADSFKRLLHTHYILSLLFLSYDRKTNFASYILWYNVVVVCVVVCVVVVRRRI